MKRVVAILAALLLVGLSACVTADVGDPGVNENKKYCRLYLAAWNAGTDYGWDSDQYWDKADLMDAQADDVTSDELADIIHDLETVPQRDLLDVVAVLDDYCGIEEE